MTITGRIDKREMKKVQIITDSASDISVQDEKKYGIKVVPFSVAFDETIYVSRKDFDNEKFYQMMEEYEEIPKTSQITVFQFEEIYEECYEQGCTDLILVLINGKGSATYNNSIMAINNFFEEHPDAKDKMTITSHDGGSYSGGYGHLVVEAAQKAEEGCSREEINQYLEENIKKREVYFGIYNLKYAGKSGRIPSAAAFLGDKIGIKPIMKIWDHQITTAGKCRGEKKLISKIIDMAVADMEPGSAYQIVYGNDDECCKEMQEKMTEKVGYGPVGLYQIGAEVAVNAGQKVVGLIFNVKEELVKERAE